MLSFSLVNLSVLGLTTCVCLALCLDKIAGEAERYHPLVGFGHIAHRIEQHLNAGRYRKLKGFLALCLSVLPVAFIAHLISLWLKDDLLAEIVFSSFVLYVAIGWQSLLDHAKAIFTALDAHDVKLAREMVTRIVSRDCSQLNETEISVAATESVLENGADAIFAAIFWFMIAGVPGVIFYRLSNTLDAMWGYKTTRFEDFGWAAAKLDDALNYFPARLTALSYTLSGNSRQAFKCWFTQARFWKSPNAGPVMAAGAGAIKVSLGGKAIYQGTTQLRPLLGLRFSESTRANANSIKAACTLINRSLFLWLIALAAMTILSQPNDVSDMLNSLKDLIAIFTSTWFDQ